MAVAGTIVVELQANTAQFQQEMGRASTGLKTISRESGNSERALAHFAAKGLGEVIPAAQGAEFAISKMIDKALHAAGALRLLGGAGVAIGGTLLVAAGVQRLQEEIKNWLALGETISQTTERLKTEADEQEKFAQKRKASVSLLIGLEGQLAQARAEASASALKAQGDLPGAAGADLEAQAAAANAEKLARDRNIIETIAAGERRNHALIASELLLAARRTKINEDYFGTLKKLQEDATAKQLDQFTTETNAMLDSLKRRLSLRKSIEDEAATAAQRQGLGDVFQPFTQADDTRQDAEKIAQGFALLLDKGKAFRDVFPEILRIDEQFQQRGFSGFATAVDNARGKFRDLGIDSQTLEQSWGALGAKLGNIPTAFQQAGAAIDPLIAKLRELEAQNFRTAQSVVALASTLATTREGPPAPDVTGPVDLGFNP